jgi:RNA polymerase sigma factor (TIGR02999 family)
MAATSAEFALQLARDGFAQVAELDVLLPVVYADLKRIAHRQLLRQVSGATLSTTVLVHETWARLAERSAGLQLTRAHLLSLSARVMRQVVIDHARGRAAGKRGGGLRRVELGDGDERIESQDQALLMLAEALDTLERADPRLVRLIEQHWFIGLEADELAQLHDVGVRTIQRELKRARAWLAELLLP